MNSFLVYLLMMNLNLKRKRKRGSTLAPGLGPAHDPESQGKMEFRKLALYRQFHGMATTNQS